MGSGALPSKILLLRIVENNKKLCLFKVRIGKVKVNLATQG